MGGLQPRDRFLLPLDPTEGCQVALTFQETNLTCVAPASQPVTPKSTSGNQRSEPWVGPQAQGPREEPEAGQGCIYDRGRTSLPAQKEPDEGSVVSEPRMPIKQGR